MAGPQADEYDGVKLDFAELSGVKGDKPNGGNDNGSTPIMKQTDRVSVWERLNHSVSKKGVNHGSQMNFANVVGSIPKPEMEYFPLEKNEKLRVHIPLEMTKGMAKTFKTVLYGYFLGPRIPFPIVLRYAQNAWGKFGFRDAMVNDHGFFFFRFNDEGGCSQVVESSPLMIKGVPLFVSPWDPSKGLYKPEHTTCPLWIKFYNIPLVAFNREGISRIASAVGVPLRMDACTTSTCDNTWGRTSFAKVLVNVWATGKLKKEVEVVIPRLSGNGEDVVKVVMEYDWEPSQCSVCKNFGHKDSSCVKAVIVQKKEKPNTIQNNKGKMDDGEWTKVERRQWKPKEGVVKEYMNNPIPKEAGQVLKSGKDTVVQKPKEGSCVMDEEPPVTMTEAYEGNLRDIQREENRRVNQNSIKEGRDKDGKSERDTKEGLSMRNTTGREDQGKENVVEKSSIPLKSILKNSSNRFSALVDRVIAFDEEPIGTSNSAIRKINEASKLGEKQGGKKGEDGSNARPKV